MPTPTYNNRKNREETTSGKQKADGRLVTEKSEERYMVQNTQEERLKLRKGGRWLIQVGSSHIMES